MIWIAVYFLFGLVVTLFVHFCEFLSLREAFKDREHLPLIMKRFRMGLELSRIGLMVLLWPVTVLICFAGKTNSVDP